MFLLLFLSGGSRRKNVFIQSPTLVCFYFSRYFCVSVVLCRVPPTPAKLFSVSVVCFVLLLLFLASSFSTSSPRPIYKHETCFRWCALIVCRRTVARCASLWPSQPPPTAFTVVGFAIGPAARLFGLDVEAKITRVFLFRGE